jgi:hypothetical protein
MAEAHQSTEPSPERDPEVDALHALDAALERTPNAVTLSADTLKTLREIFSATAELDPEHPVALAMAEVLATAEPDTPFPVGGNLAGLVRQEVADTLAYAREPRMSIELTPELIEAVKAAVAAERNESNPEAA